MQGPAVLLLAASTLLVCAHQKAGTAKYKWGCPMIVSRVVLSIVCWVAFFARTAWLSLGNKAFRESLIVPLNVTYSQPTGPANSVKSLIAQVEILPIKSVLSF